MRNLPGFKTVATLNLKGLRFKPVASPVIQGWQNFPGGIAWYKIWELISCYHNQMNNVCAGRELSGMLQRPRLSSTKISGDLFLPQI